MAAAKRTEGGELFIVDNSDADWKVLQYLKEWCEVARAFDIATGYFEIGALLAMEGAGQKLEKFRVRTGDEVSWHKLGPVASPDSHGSANQNCPSSPLGGKLEITHA